MRPDSF